MSLSGDVLKAALALYDHVRWSGSPGLVTIGGEAGIGKTTLLEAIRDAIRADNRKPAARVGLGRTPMDSPGYEPIQRALDDLFARTPLAERLRRTAVATAPAWLELIPSLGGAVKAIVSAAGAARHPVLAPVDQLLALIRDVADGHPVVLEFDDFHWANAHSASVLRDVLAMAAERRLPIMLVAAYRTTRRVPLDLPAGCERLDRVLSGLDNAEVSALIEKTTGHAPPPRLAEWLRRRTGGNPKFVIELVKHWTGGGAGRMLDLMEPGDLPLPRSVEDALAHRFERLLPDERRVLELASVAGEPVFAHELADVADLPASAVRAIIRALCREHGLLDAAEADDAYEFTHPLVPEVARAQLRADRHDFRRVCVRWAEVIDARPGVAFEALAATPRLWRDAGRIDCAIAAAVRCGHVFGLRQALREPLKQLALRVRRWAVASKDGGLLAQAEMLVAEQLPQTEFGERLRRYTRALQLATDDFSRALAMGSIPGVEVAGNADYGRGELASQAVELLEALIREPAHPMIARRRMNALETVACAAVWIPMRVGDWPTARRAADRLRRITTEVLVPPYSPIHPDEHHSLPAELLAASGRWAEAEPLLRQAIAVGEPAQTVTAKGLLGLARCHQGDMEGGSALLREALRVVRDVMGSVEGAAKLLTSVGDLHRDRREWTDAACAYWLALPLWLELDHAQAARARAGLAEVERRLGEAEFAALREGFVPWESQWAEFAFLWGLAPFRKHGSNPVMVAGGQPWEADAVFNPAAIVQGHRIQLAYRAVAAGRSVIGLATSGDGVSFARRAEPIVAPVEAWEKPGGCEDPRLVRLGSRVVMTYTAYDGQIARIAGREGPDLLSLGAPRLALPESHGWCKSAVVLPEQIDGRWWMYFGDTHIWAAWTDRADLSGWHVIGEPVLSPRPGHFDSRLVEPGPVPLIGSGGILLIYNGADDSLRYAVGQALFSPQDPTVLLRRSATPVLEVDHDIEREGAVPNVVFASGLVRHEDRWLLYFGMGDLAIGLATSSAPMPS